MYYWDDQIKEDEMGEACSAHGRRERSKKVWFKSTKGRDQLEDLGIYGRIILKWILGTYGWRCGLDSSDIGQGPMKNSCEHGNETFCYIKGREFIHWLSFLRRTLHNRVS
jgi:hypothetical protein